MANAGCVPVAIVAESDEETRRLIKSLLELLGFAVVEAQNGQEAYESARCYQPDLVLIELKLPILKGYSAIRRFKRDGDLSGVPIIAMSDRDANASQNLALAAGCSAHVDKPIEFDHLESVVENLVPCDRLSVVSLLVH